MSFQLPEEPIFSHRTPESQLALRGLSVSTTVVYTIDWTPIFDFPKFPTNQGGESSQKG